jgi:hypothetical protein
MSTEPALMALSRRDLFGRAGTGLAGLALAGLLPAAAVEPSVANTAARSPHHSARAKSVIQLFMHGGPSQMDLLDPKPALDRYDGKPFPGAIDIQETDKAGGVLRSPFRFAPHGESGTAVSELLPHLAKRVDDIALIRSMHTEHLNHEPALWMIHTGETMPGRPSIGSWITYGLGSENQNLPAYVVLDDPKGLPVDGIRNWSSGWLPPLYQGTRFRSEGTAVWNLAPHKSVPPELQRARRSLLSEIDREHREKHPGEAELDARIASYELAARMQLSATEAIDLANETAATQSLYGIDNPVTASYGRRCLMARRLVERGVRFVQIFLEQQIWDHHSGIKDGLISACARTDQPCAALLQDLQERGLLNETLVMWGGEFGRLPISQAADGRDHNNKGFSMWLAGGGIKAGYVHGATDEFGYASVEKPMGVRDLHATILQLLGLDHRQLLFHRNGLDERLTGIHHPQIVTDLIN